MKRNNKGITLIALVITIIVMLILVVVTINVATDGGLIAKAKKAADETKRAAELEELEIENAAKAANGEAFIVELADEFGNKYKYYRLDKVTDEQREKCRENGIPMLLGDVNFDSKITNEDVTLISEMVVGGQEEENEKQNILADVDLDGEITGSDSGLLSRCLDGTFSLRIQAISKETGISTDKILMDEENGILYYIEVGEFDYKGEEATNEEKQELEKYGVKKARLGDVNLDGKITMEDYNILFDVYSCLVSKNIINDFQYILADLAGRKSGFDDLDVQVLKDFIDNGGE